MSGQGALSLTLLHVRSVVADVLTPLKWTVETADTPFQAWSALFAPRLSGVAILAFDGDAAQAQANQSLVAKMRFTITLCARKSLTDKALSKLQPSGDSADPRLFEVHDTIKGALLAAEVPTACQANAGEKWFAYAGALPLTSPEGIPVDAVKQTWTCTLKETYAPEFNS